MWRILLSVLALHCEVVEAATCDSYNEANCNTSNDGGCDCAWENGACIKTDSCSGFGPTSIEDGNSTTPPATGINGANLNALHFGPVVVSLLKLLNA
mmetsp:Transcript_131279/g.185266  ORF Transcript_131279/g.185266 Transcript_131279/m.185266 type:complete len:97 (+) Transcript_131279:46-336(+)